MASSMDPGPKQAIDPALRARSSPASSSSPEARVCMTDPAQNGGANGSRDLPPGGAPAPDHRAQFYESETLLAKNVSEYLGEGLRRGEGLVVIASVRHWAAFRERLAPEGPLLDEATRSGRIVVLDVVRTLEAILVGGTPNDDAFRSMVGGAFDMTAGCAPSAPVRAYGEMVDLLWCGDRASSAVTLERMWNVFLAQRPSPLLCSYRMSGSYRRDQTQHIDAI